MFSRQSHCFKDGLGQTYAFTLWPQFDSTGEPRREAVIRSKVYARQALDSIATSPEDPLNYGLLDLWLEVFQKPWAQPRNLHSLIDDLTGKIAKGELFVYLEDSPVWHFQSSGVGGGEAQGGAPDTAVADIGRTQTVAAQNASAAASRVERPAPQAPNPALQFGNPESLEDAERILNARREEIKTVGYQQKYSDAELLGIAEKGEVNDRFLVRLIFNDPESSKATTLGFRRPSGRAPYWSTTFDQAEAADTDPELLAALFGIPNYSPDQAFSLAIIDRENMPVQAEREQFIPTYAAMTAFGERELGAKEGIGPGTMHKVMNKEVSADYLEFRKDYDETGENVYDAEIVKEFIAWKAPDNNKKLELRTRHKLETELGANPLFTGSGLTKVATDSHYTSEIGQQYGAVEIFTFERDPLLINDLEKIGAVQLLPAKPIRT